MVILLNYYRSLNSRRCAGLYRLWEVPEDNYLYLRPCVGMTFKKKKSRTSPTVVPQQCLTVCAVSAGAGWRRHGDYYPDHLVLAAALRVEAEELSGGSHVIGEKTDSTGMLVKVGGCHNFFLLVAGCVSGGRDRLPHLGDLLR